jgi:hypothetical protein
MADSNTATDWRIPRQPASSATARSTACGAATRPRRRVSSAPASPRANRRPSRATPTSHAVAIQGRYSRSKSPTAEIAASKRDGAGREATAAFCGLSRLADGVETVAGSTGSNTPPKGSAVGCDSLLPTWSTRPCGFRATNSNLASGFPSGRNANHVTIGAAVIRANNASSATYRACGDLRRMAASSTVARAAARAPCHTKWSKRVERRSTFGVCDQASHRAARLETVMLEMVFILLSPPSHRAVCGFLRVRRVSRVRCPRRATAASEPSRRRPV